MKDFCINAKMQLAQYDELTDSDKRLVDMAKDATNRSYAPYSHFRVGAALLMANGETVIGCNQENAVFPAGLCAERTAIFSAQAQYPDVVIETLAIAARNTSDKFVTEPVSPCGSCRQVILEQECRLNHPIRILLVGESGILIINTIKDLLPLCFMDESMRG